MTSDGASSGASSGSSSGHGHLMPSHADYASHLFETGLFSDCIISANGSSWNLHRAILSQRCDFFRACFVNSFKEASSDAAPGLPTVSMHDDHAAALGRALKWLYTLEYPVPDNDSPHCPSHGHPRKPGSNDAPDHFWTSELALFTVADKYGLVILAEQASASICHVASQCSWDLKLEPHAQSFLGSIDDFIDMLNVLYTDLSAVSANVTKLREDLLRCSAVMIAAQTTQQSQLTNLVAGIPELARDLVEALRQKVERYASNIPDDDHTALPPTSRRSSAIHGPRTIYRSGSDSDAGGRSPTRRTGSESESVKVHIPMNEDSDVD